MNQGVNSQASFVTVPKDPPHLSNTFLCSVMDECLPEEIENTDDVRSLVEGVWRKIVSEYGTAPMIQQRRSQRKVQIFTDGSCIGNPGPGGWAALIKSESGTQEISGGEHNTTNNRMELLAAIKALQALDVGCNVSLTTDSQYLRNGITSWIKKWQTNGWKTGTKQPVKNADLWKLLLEETKRHKIRWYWVKGHSGHAENDIVDKLANQAARELA